MDVSTSKQNNGSDGGMQRTRRRSSSSGGESDLVVLSVVFNKKKQKQNDEVAIAIERLRENGVNCVLFTMNELRNGTRKQGSNGLPDGFLSRSKDSEGDSERNIKTSEDSKFTPPMPLLPLPSIACDASENSNGSTDSESSMSIQKSVEQVINSFSASPSPSPPLLSPQLTYSQHTSSVIENLTPFANLSSFLAPLLKEANSLEKKDPDKEEHKQQDVQICSITSVNPPKTRPKRRRRKVRRYYSTQKVRKKKPKKILTDGMLPASLSSKGSSPEKFTVVADSITSSDEIVNRSQTSFSYSSNEANATTIVDNKTEKIVESTTCSSRATSECDLTAKQPCTSTTPVVDSRIPVPDSSSSILETLDKRPVNRKSICRRRLALFSKRPMVSCSTCSDSSDEDDHPHSEIIDSLKVKIGTEDTKTDKEPVVNEELAQESLSPGQMPEATETLVKPVLEDRKKPCEGPVKVPLKRRKKKKRIYMLREEYNVRFKVARRSTPAWRYDSDSDCLIEFVPMDSVPGRPLPRHPWSSSSHYSDESEVAHSDNETPVSVKVKVAKEDTIMKTEEVSNGKLVSDSKLPVRLPVVEKNLNLPDAANHHDHQSNQTLVKRRRGRRVICRRRLASFSKRARRSVPMASCSSCAESSDEDQDVQSEKETAISSKDKISTENAPTDKEPAVNKELNCEPLSQRQTSEAKETVVVPVVDDHDEPSEAPVEIPLQRKKKKKRIYMSRQQYNIRFKVARRSTAAWRYDSDSDVSIEIIQYDDVARQSGPARVYPFVGNSDGNTRSSVSASEDESRFIGKSKSDPLHESSEANQDLIDERAFSPDICRISKIAQNDNRRTKACSSSINESADAVPCAETGDATDFIANCVQKNLISDDLNVQKGTKSQNLQGDNVTDSLPLQPVATNPSRPQKNRKRRSAYAHRRKKAKPASKPEIEKLFTSAGCTTDDFANGSPAAQEDKVSVEDVQTKMVPDANGKIDFESLPSAAIPQAEKSLSLSDMTAGREKPTETYENSNSKEELNSITTSINGDSLLDIRCSVSTPDVEETTATIEKQDAHKDEFLSNPEDSLPSTPDGMQLRRSKFYSLITENVRKNMDNYLDGRQGLKAQVKRRKRVKNSYLLNHGDNYPDDPEVPYRLNLATQVLLKLNKRRIKCKPKEDRGKTLLSYLRLTSKRPPRTGKPVSSVVPMDETPVSFEEPVFTGEWSITRKYICHVCGQTENCFWNMVMHKGEQHPGVLVTHTELPNHVPFGLVRKLPASTAEHRSTSTDNSLHVCTKCTTNFNTLDELHKHIFECAGNAFWLITEEEVRKKKSKRRRGFKRRLSNTPKTTPKKQKVSEVKGRPSEVFKCDLCSREFKTEGWLKNHVITHSLPVSIPLEKLSLPSRASNNSTSSRLFKS